MAASCLLIIVVRRNHIVYMADVQNKCYVLHCVTAIDDPKCSEGLNLNLTMRLRFSCNYFMYTLITFTAAINSARSPHLFWYVSTQLYDVHATFGI